MTNIESMTLPLAEVCNTRNTMIIRDTKFTQIPNPFIIVIYYYFGQVISFQRYQKNKGSPVIHS